MIAGAQAFPVGDLTSVPIPSWPPHGTSMKFSVTRDTWISSAGGEEDGSNGGAELLKVKGQQEYSILDIDVSALKGRIVTGALLHVRSASPGDAPFARLGVSSLASEWVEGTSRNYRPQEPSSCFHQAEYRTRNWAYQGSTIMDVAFGRGHTLWKFADCSPPDGEGWQACAVDPDVVAARVAGISHGFLLYDEVGNIWSLKDGKFSYTYFPNRNCHSSESRTGAPWLEVWTSGLDTAPPENIGSIQAETVGLPAGQALVRWTTPQDQGGGKTLGFLASYGRDGEESPVSRYLVPMAGATGEGVLMHIQDLPFEPGELIDLNIRPVDNAGNVGMPFTKSIKLSSGCAPLPVPEADIEPFQPNTSLPSAGGVRIAVVDMLDKIDPRSGDLIPPRPDGYKGGNHIFSAREKRVRLYAARNETMAFQLNLEGHSRDISVDYTFDENKNLRPRLYQFAHVNVMDKNGKVVSALPDPLVELEKTCSVPSTGGQTHIPHQTNLSLILELYVPHEEVPGIKKGKVTVAVGKDVVELDVDLTVWGFTLPNKLSFVPEMNAYTTVSPYEGYDYYRLAHEHRTCMNRLPYGWHGLPSFAPAWNGEDFDWSEWDRKVGPLLDGSAFGDLPRNREPLDVFYLPFSENWPVSLFGNYTPSYWADEAFSDSYKDELQRAFASFAAHCNQKGWADTIFQFYLNNKVYYRKNFPGSSAPWLFDEPVNTQDFWALRWYGLLWHQAVGPVKGNARMWYRGDISFSQFERNILWGITDVEYLGGNNAQKTRMKLDEKVLEGSAHFAEYGAANDIKSSNTQPVLWCISAWMRGATGVLPWQTIEGANCWKVAERTALFYPHPEGPKPSVRLKAFMRGQQDTEYFTLLGDIYKRPHYVVTEWLKEIINPDDQPDRAVRMRTETTGFTTCDVVALWNMRYRIGQAISKAAPAYKRVLVDRVTPQFDVAKMPQIGYVQVSPQIERLRPETDNSEFRGTGSY